MAVSLAIIVIFGLFADYLFRKLKLPGLVGMLFTGVLCGPYVFDIIQPELLHVSSDLRMTALIVILLRAGLEMRRDTLNRVGKPVLLLAVVPAVFEGVVITLLGPHFLHITYLESAILGAIIAAVSPAVVVPFMINFIDRKIGTKKGIPTLMLAGSSVDDVFVIVIFSMLLGIYTGTNANILLKLLEIPGSILFGIGVGAVTGYILYHVFERYNFRATKMTIVIVAVSILLTWLEEELKTKIAV